MKVTSYHPRMDYSWMVTEAVHMRKRLSVKELTGVKDIEQRTLIKVKIHNMDFGEVCNALTPTDAPKGVSSVFLGFSSRVIKALQALGYEFTVIVQAGVDLVTYSYLCDTARDKWQVSDVVDKFKPLLDKISKPAA